MRRSYVLVGAAALTAACSLLVPLDELGPTTGDAGPSDGAIPVDSGHCKERDCLGGSCVLGVCQPIRLASGLANPVELVVDGDDVFVSLRGTSALDGAPSYSDGTVIAMRRDGSARTPLFAPTSSARGPSALAVDATYVYFGADTSGTLFRVPRAGGQLTPLVTNQGSPNGMALDSTEGALYWTNFFDVDTVAKTSLAAPAEITLSRDPGGFGGRVRLLPTEVAYQTESQGTIRAVPRSGCLDGGVCRRTLATIGADAGLQLNGFDIEGSSLCYAVFPLPGEVRCSALDGGAARTLATGFAETREVVIDGADVYFARAEYLDSTRAGIYRVPLDGSAKPVLVASTSGLVRGLAVDAVSVYWITPGKETAFGIYDRADGEVWRVAK